MQTAYHKFPPGTPPSEIRFELDQYLFRAGRVVLTFEMYDHQGLELTAQNVKELGLSTVASFYISYID